MGNSLLYRSNSHTQRLKWNLFLVLAHTHAHAHMQMQPSRTMSQARPAGRLPLLLNLKMSTWSAFLFYTNRVRVPHAVVSFFFFFPYLALSETAYCEKFFKMLIEMDITFSFLYSTLLSYWANKCFSSLWNSNKYIKFKKIIKMAFQPGSRGGRGGMFAIKCFFFFCSYPSSLLCFQVGEWSD